MPIPQEILSLKRPVNTVVIAYGKGKRLFSVRQRIGCKNIGGRHIPVIGPTIGHLVNGQYVPLSSNAIYDVAFSCVDMKDWAGILFSETVFSDILQELQAVYSVEDSLKKSTPFQCCVFACPE